MFRIYACFILMLFIGVLPVVVMAQTTTIDGHVREKGSGEPLPFAHVVLKGTNTGATTDTAGYFSILINNSELKGADTLIVSYLGYLTNKVAIVRGSQHLNIDLAAEFFQLDELVVRPGENQAWPILRNVIANKEKNNPDFRERYSSEEYSKIRFDLNHFTDKIKKNILVRPFDYIWKNVDTNADGVTYLPVLLVEKMVRHYYQRSPKETKDFVDGVNTTGLAGPKIMKFVEDLYQVPNFYDNYVVILEKSFAGPLNDNYKNNYKFYLTDSTGHGDGKAYKITFRPKQKRDLAFIGEMYIDSANWALKEISVRFDIQANVNFVRSFWINQKYEAVGGKHWMLKESNVIGDFTVIENSSDLTGFFGRKNATFHNYVIDSELPPRVFKGVDRVVEADSATHRSDQYWTDARHIALTKEDNGIFGMAAQLEKDPRFILRKKLVVALVSGYYPVHKVDIGNFYSFYSYNGIERSRVKLGFKTVDDWAVPLSLAAYAAYGTHDRVWKYNAEAAYTLGAATKHKTTVGGGYRYDINQLGRSPNNMDLDNVFSSLVQLGAIDASRNYVRDLNAYTEHIWSTGLTTRINYNQNTISPTPGGAFFATTPTGTTELRNNYNAAGVDLTLRYSWQNKNARAVFYDEKDFKTTFRKYPDVALQYRIADKGLFGGDVSFQKVRASLRQQIRTKKLGYFKYYIEAGKTMGTVPYPYLDMPFGNQLVLFDDYAFNLMKFMEYASDEYVSIHMEQHIEGLLLDRIPLINKLKWRNFFFAKGYIGALSAENYQQQYLFPKSLSRINDPYVEVGFGIENIFRIARMDFVWRLTDQNKPGVYYFIVKPSFRFTF